jgi:hypothetical protein
MTKVDLNIALKSPFAKRYRGRPRPGAVRPIRRMLRRLFAHVLPVGDFLIGDNASGSARSAARRSRPLADAAALLLRNQRRTSHGSRSSIFTVA